jgi:tRNA-specific adenosine deaminase 2
MNATNRTYNGTRHAEFLGINDILTQVDPVTGEKLYGLEVLSECDLYVTVEPCIMCASLLRQMGVRKVYFGASNEKFGGTGGVLNIQRRTGAPEKEGNGEEEGKEERMMEEGDYEVSGGWLREEAIVILRRFYVQENERGKFSSVAGRLARN